MIIIIIGIIINTDIMDIVNTDKLKLPQLRKIMPSLIASDIVGVQPMAMPSSAFFTMNGRYFTAILVDKVGEWDNIIGTEFGYYIITNLASMNDDHPVLIDAIAWCNTVMKDRYLVSIDQDNYHRFYFKHKQDRTLFILKFGEQ